MRAAMRAGVFLLALAAALPLRASLSRGSLPAPDTAFRFCAATLGVGSSALGVERSSPSDASLATEYDCDPYGNVIAERGPAAGLCPFRHKTRYYDREDWLYYYGYRYFDPSVCKWISKDPLGESGGWNLTAFCANDPVNNYDALGLAGEGFLYNWLADLCENGKNDTGSPFASVFLSGAECSLRSLAGLDPVFASDQMARHVDDVYGALGATEGTKAIAKEVAWGWPRPRRTRTG